MSELAVVSARKNRLQERAEDGSRGARIALHLADNPNRFLSTVQVGITLIGILTGAFGGATLAEEIGAWLSGISFLAPYSAGLGVVIVVITITYFSLVLGELVPKRLALNNAEGIAVRFSGAMWILSKATTPLVSLLSLSTDIVLRILRIRPSPEPPVTEEDVQSMISQGTQLGIFEESEREMVTHIFRLGDRRISTVMTPRTDVTFINAEAGRDEWIQLVIESGYSRFPVFIDTLDNVIGMVHVKDLLHQSMKGWPFDLQSALQAPIFVPETATILEVLEQIKQNGIEMALVIDEFGGLMGLVSLNDILEAIVGDVELPLAGEDPDVVRREDGSYLIEGMLKLDELKDVLDVETLPDEEKGYYETLGGFLMTQLGRIPATGDSYDWQGYHFEVVDMDGRRVDKVLVVPLK